MRVTRDVVARVAGVPGAVRATVEVVGLMLAAFVAVWVARTVGPAYVGYFAVAVAIFQLGAVVINVGLAQAGSQRVGNDAERSTEAWWTVCTGRIAPAVAATGLGEALVAVTPLDPTLASYLRVGLLAWLALPFRSEWLLVARGLVGSASAVRLAGALASAVTAVTLIRRDSDAGFVPLLLVLPTAVAAFVSVALLVRLRLIRSVPSPRSLVGAIREYLSDGRHYLKADLSVFVYMSSDRLFLYAFSTPTVVGLYDAAYKVIQPFYSVSAVVGDAMFLPLTHAFAEQRLAPVFRRYVDLMCVATIPFGFLMTAYSPWLIGLLYGDRFAGAAVYLAILGWVITFGYTSGVVVIPFLSWNRPREYGNAVLGGSVVNLVLNLALIPPMAGIGAAVATVAAKVAVTLAGIRYFWKATSYPVLRDFVVYFAISAVAFAASVSAIAVLRSADGVGVLVFGGTYLVLAAVTRLPAHVGR